MPNADASPSEPSDSAAPEPAKPSTRATAWLALGAIVGMGVAAYGLLSTDSSRGLPAGTVARVNDTLIFEDAYQRLVAGLESDTREPATPEIRRRVLDRMIEEELLVQRGLELGLAESDRRVRADITSTMIRSVVVEAEDEEPSAGDLQEFYQAEGGFFTQPGRVRVAQVFVRVRGAEEDRPARERAALARQALVAGASLDEARQEFGDEEISPVPDAMLPPAKLREYVGPTALRSVMDLPVGEFGKPVRSGTGYHVFLVLEREEARTPPLEDIREQVRNEWVRRAGDRALRDYLNGLRKQAAVEVQAELR